MSSRPRPQSASAEPRTLSRREFAEPSDVVRIVERLVRDALAVGASDVHVEAGEESVRVRHRVDGVLRAVETLPRDVGLPLVSRLKILAGLDIADRLRPQDGRARVRTASGEIELRLSTLPASRGENLVLRLPAPEAAAGTFAALGLAADDAARLEALLDAREGLVLVTGPTGSGKTTTLYAALARVQERGGVNVVTVEDPVERRIPGVVQVQVNERTGLTFAAALRAILRQDPDVVLVGEVRDRETAAIAAQAALTGHLVLATLHTIDAASAITRLADVGVEPATVAAALRGVVAQRLVRRLCVDCRRARAPGWRDDRLRGSPPEGEPGFVAVTATVTDDAQADRPPCAACGGSGYRGRVALAEVLRADAVLTRMLADGADAPALSVAARGRGMRTLWESGVAAVRAGVTSAEELLRVVDPPMEGGERGSAARVAERAPGRDASAVRLADAVVMPDLETFDLLPPVARRRTPFPLPP